MCRIPQVSPVRTGTVNPVGRLPKGVLRRARPASWTSAQVSAPSRRHRVAGPRHSTTVDGTPSQVPPSSTRRVGSASPSATTTASAVVAGGCPWRLALVTASGPSRSHSSTTTGWSGRRTPTVWRAGRWASEVGGEPRPGDDHECQRPGPETVGEVPRRRLQMAGHQLHLVPSRPPGSAGARPAGRPFEGEQPLHRLRLGGIDCQPVDGVGRDGHHRSPGQGPGGLPASAPGSAASGEHRGHRRATSIRSRPARSRPVPTWENPARRAASMAP